MQATASDEALLEQYRREYEPGVQSAALDELFERHHRRVALWCLRFAGDRDRACDLAQEVFLKAYRSLDSYRGSAKFSTWLYVIARNHCFNAAKARSRGPEELPDPEMLDLLVDKADDPYRRLERQRRAETARELLDAELDDNERRAMVLHYQEGLPLDAVTRLLGLTNPSGAKASIVSARRKLTRALERRRRAQRPAL